MFTPVTSSSMVTTPLPLQSPTHTPTGRVEVGDAAAVGVIVALSVRVTVALAVGVTVAVAVGVTVALAVGVAVSLIVAVTVALAVADGGTLAVACMHTPSRHRSPGMKSPPSARQA